LWTEVSPVATVIIKERLCKEFFEYKPGYKPDDHRGLMEKSHDHLREIIIGAVSLVAGAFLCWLGKRLGF
jgi:hypothetical protein